VQGIKDLMQRLIDAWTGAEESVIQNASYHHCRHIHTSIQPQEDIMIIHCEKNLSKRLNLV